MSKFKIEILEAYEIKMEVEADTPEQAKLAAIDATEAAMSEAMALGMSKLAWRQFKAVVPVEDKRGGSNKGTPHKSKQKGER